MVLVAAGLPVLSAADASAADVGTAAYQSRSDEQLTTLAAQWDALNTHERRALLTEMKSRMAARGGKQKPVLRIRTERRYGRIIRQPDGRVIRIEANVVRVQPVTPEMLARVESQGGFGVGFERRVGVRGEPETGASEVPAVTDEAATQDGPRSEALLPILRASDVAP